MLLAKSMEHRTSWEVHDLVKKFPVFYRTGRFITTHVRARHWYLSWARSVHSPPLHPSWFLDDLFNISFPCTHRSLEWSVPSRTQYAPPLFPTLATYPAHHNLLNHPRNNICWRSANHECPHAVSSIHLLSRPSWVQISSLITVFLKTLGLCSTPQCDRPSFHTHRTQQKYYRSDVWLTVHRNSVWIRKTN